MKDVLLAIFGAICGGFVTHYVEAEFRRRDAVQRFRYAFVEEIALCMSGNDFRIKDALRKVLVKHRCAVILIEPFLRKNSRVRFLSLWKKYCELLEVSPLNEFVPEAGVHMEGYIREFTEVEQRENSLKYLRSLVELVD